MGQQNRGEGGGSGGSACSTHRGRPSLAQRCLLSVQSDSAPPGSVYETFTRVPERRTKKVRATLASLPGEAPTPPAPPPPSAARPHSAQGRGAPGSQERGSRNPECPTHLHAPAEAVLRLHPRRVPGESLAEGNAPRWGHSGCRPTTQQAAAPGAAPSPWWTPSVSSTNAQGDSYSRERAEERFPAWPQRAGPAGRGKDRQTAGRAGVSPHAAVAGSHWVVENNILLGQLQQHGVIEELADAHVLAQALPGNRKGRGYCSAGAPTAIVAEIPPERPGVPQQDPFLGSRGSRICRGSSVAQQLEDTQQPLTELQVCGGCC